MEPSADRENLSFDPSLLKEFLYALNILRRQIAAYPAGHPMIDVALNNLLQLNNKLLEFRHSITIGIARDTLLVENYDLNPRDPVLKDLAKNLFDAKVASLTITKDLTAGEICQFLQILRVRKGVDAGADNLAQRLDQAGILGLTAREIDFSAFHKTEATEITAPKPQFVESETAVLWKAFAEGLSRGTLDPHGAKAAAGVGLDPELLADVLNKDLTDPDATEKIEASYEEAITVFLAKSFREQVRSQARKETLGRLARLIEKLNPELRLRFINSTLKSCAVHEELAEEVVSSLPQSAILMALEQADSTLLQIPEFLLDILGKLAAHRDKGDGGSRVVGGRRRAAHTAEAMTRLFQADHVEDFVGKDYRDALKVLAKADVATSLEPGEVATLTSAIDGHLIDQQFCGVLLDLLQRGAEPQFNAAMVENLEELVGYFTDTGDFATLAGIHEQCRSLRQGRGDATPAAVPDGLLEVFSTAKFVDKFLDGLELWDKSAYPSLIALVREVGTPLVVPLLDRLADEQNLSRRHLLMACLKNLGSAARDAVLARLEDTRWYFVRNLVILLRDENDPEVLRPLRHLLDHSHPKVKHEVLATFLKFNDRRVSPFLLAELRSKDVERLQGAIKLASKSDDPEVIGMLAWLLNERLPLEHEKSLKASIINSLAETGSRAAFPELKKFLLSRHLLQTGKMTQLKIAALQSLPRYDDPSSLALAEAVARSASGEVGQVAAAIALQLKGKAIP